MSTKRERRYRRLRRRLREAMSPRAWAKLIASEAAQRAASDRAKYSKPKPAPVVDVAAERRAAAREAFHARQAKMMADAVAAKKEEVERLNALYYRDKLASDETIMGPHSSVTVAPNATEATRRALVGGGT